MHFSELSLVKFKICECHSEQYSKTFGEKKAVKGGTDMQIQQADPETIPAGQIRSNYVNIVTEIPL